MSSIKIGDKFYTGKSVMEVADLAVGETPEGRLVVLAVMRGPFSGKSVVRVSVLEAGLLWKRLPEDEGDDISADTAKRYVDNLGWTHLPEDEGTVH